MIDGQELAHLAVLERMAVLGEKRDVAAEMHTRRVGDLTGLLARTMGVAEAEASLLQLAARLHDIGTLAIPSPLLLRPAPLTPGERGLMQSHAIHGAELLAGTESPLLNLAGLIARTHHERWDGTGYPNRLRENEIPLAGRIVAVADAFDAMTTTRPYRRGWSTTVALAEIEACAGTQFDPKVVLALRQLLLNAASLAA